MTRRDFVVPVPEDRLVRIGSLSHKPSSGDEVVGEGRHKAYIRGVGSLPSGGGAFSEVMMLSPNLWIWRASNQRSTSDSTAIAIPFIDHFICRLHCFLAIRFPVVPLHLAGGDRALEVRRALLPSDEAHRSTFTR
jgi:hypothetical protein